MTTTPLLDRSRPWLHEYARRQTRRYADVLAAEDVRALVDYAIVLAARHYEPGRGAAFSTYARSYVRGVLFDAIGEELAYRRACSEERAAPRAPARPPRAPRRAVARALLDALPPQDARFLVRHAAHGESLSDLAREAGRHRAWATRKLATLTTRLRALAEDEPQATAPRSTARQRSSGA